MILIAAIVLWLAAATPAAAEPVSTAIGLTTLISSGLGVTTATAGLIGGTLISVGASFALGQAAAIFRESDSQQLQGGFGVSVATDENVREPDTRVLPPQRLAVGAPVQSGALFFERYEPPYMWRGYVLGNHESGAFIDLYMGDERVPLDANGLSIAPPFFDGTNNYLEVSYRSGAPDQGIDRIISRDFGSEVGAQFRQQETTTAVLKAFYGTSDNDHSNVYGSDSRFNPLFHHQAAKVIDPRVPGCVIEDPRTWVTARTGSLNVLRLLYHPWPKMRHLDPSRIDWDLQAAIADIDDEWRATKEGTLEPNHACDGVILSDYDPVVTLREMLTSCDGFLVQRGGKYHVMSGRKQQPAGTLTQDMLLGGLDIQEETPDSRIFDGFRVEFIEPTRRFNLATSGLIERPARAERIGRVSEATLPYKFTTGHAAAVRLGTRRQIDVLGGKCDNSRRRAMSATWSVEARHYRAGQVIRVAFRDLPHLDGTYIIKRTKRVDGTLGVEIDLETFTNERLDYNAATDQPAFELLEAA